MPVSKTDSFIKEVLSCIKSPFDKKDIEEELRNHISDMIDDYIDQGYYYQSAEANAIKNMGDSKDLGKLLNQEHRPWIGWIWKITQVTAIFMIIINVIIYGVFFLDILFSKNPSIIKKEDAVYHIELDEKVKIDDRVIHITDVIYEQNGKLNIIYNSYNTKYKFSNWSGYIGEFRDDLGNYYHSGSRYKSSGLISKCSETLSGFNENAKKLFIEYDLYNRNYTIEISLDGGSYGKKN